MLGELFGRANCAEACSINPRLNREVYLTITLGGRCDKSRGSHVIAKTHYATPE